MTRPPRRKPRELVVKLRTWPMSTHTRYGCTAGMGCGYMLNWREWWFTYRPGHPNTNKMYAKEEDDGPPEESDR